MAAANNSSPQASTYGQHFRQWWSVARQSEEPPSPYDFLLNFGVRPEVVQQISWEILYQSCNTGFVSLRPGLLDYFVRQFFFTNEAEDASFPEWKVRNYRTEYCFKRFDQLMKYAIIQGPPVSDDLSLISMEDIKSVAKLAALSQKDCKDSRYYRNWVAFIKETMLRNYNSEILQLMFGLLPAHEGDNEFVLSFSKLGTGRDIPTKRQAVDLDCMLGLGQVLPKLQSLNLKDEPQWTECAFVKCMEMVGKTTSLRQLDIRLPNRWAEDTNTVPSKIAAKPSRESRSGAAVSSCGLKYCNVEAHSHSVCGGLAVAQLLPCMPSLKGLLLESLGSTPFEAAAPYIVQAIHNSPLLEDLNIRNWDSNPNKMDVLGVFDALKGAVFLKKFFYSESKDTKADEYELYANKMLEVFERNTKLTRLSLDNGVLWYDEDEDEPAWQEKLDYYLDLNHFGRSTARDSNTALGDFVALLYNWELGTVDVETNRVICPRRYEHRTLCFPRLFNIHFGLLRETPGLWSGTTGRSRKRKQAGD